MMSHDETEAFGESTRGESGGLSIPEVDRTCLGRGLPSLQLSSLVITTGREYAGKALRDLRSVQTMVSHRLNYSRPE